MRKMARTTMLGFTLALALNIQVSAQIVGGSYILEGRNFDDSPYTGTVRIIPQGATCRIVWHTGNSQSEGLCMQSSKTLAAFYRLGSEYGLVIYELQPDGSFRGHWSVAGKQGVGFERLVPQK